MNLDTLPVGWSKGILDTIITHPRSIFIADSFSQLPGYHNVWYKIPEEERSGWHLFDSRILSMGTSADNEDILIHEYCFYPRLSEPDDLNYIEPNSEWLWIEWMNLR